MISILTRTPVSERTRTYLDECEHQINAALLAAQDALIDMGYAALDEETSALIRTVLSDERYDMVPR